MNLKSFREERMSEFFDPMENEDLELQINNK